jgi:DNA-binding NarL/FixJ family response regulator
VLLSQHIDVENALLLFSGDPHGVGYLLKDRVADVDDFLAAVRRIAAGGTAIDHSILAELRSGLWSEQAQELLEAAAADAAVVGGETTSDQRFIGPDAA